MPCAIVYLLPFCFSSPWAAQIKDSESATHGGDAAAYQAIEGAADHIEPIELADRILRREPQLLVVDVGTTGEFARFHIRGSINATLSEPVEVLQPYRNAGTIILYSNGMTHPPQAQDALYRMGYRNVYILTDGLKGFIETCLKPVSLRSEPVPQEFAARIAAWRDYFVTRATTASLIPSKDTTIVVHCRTGLIRQARLFFF